MEIEIREEQFPNAQALLDALRMETWTNNSEWKCPWVFRGQRDANWNLTPSAWRNMGSGGELSRLDQLRSHFARENISKIRTMVAQHQNLRDANLTGLVEAYLQARAEFKLIHEFVMLADELGHQVPDIEIYRRYDQYDYLSDLQNYPNLRLLPDLNSAAALAQHHGVPTRAIDFTRNPLIAAFFAANDVNASDVRKSKTDTRIAVWAVRPDLLSLHGCDDEFNLENYSRFMADHLPNSYNHYLRAQEGLFIQATYGCAHYAKNRKWPSLEEFACRVSVKCGKPAIRKLSLPVSEVGELLRLLWLNGISKAHLMPTLDNVGQALWTRWRWARS